MRYRHIFFDLDHTLWDFETNAKDTLNDLYHSHELSKRGIEDFDGFFDRYSYHNERLWDRYTKGFIKQDELRWKRMWLTYAFQQTGANEKESIMIGDNLDADIQGGINAGMDTVFVNHLNIAAHIQPTYTVYHLKELEHIL